MSERYYGGVQTPLTLALLRAAATRRRFGAYTEFQLNDTDTAGVTPAEQLGFEVTWPVARRWQPVYWVHPLAAKRQSQRCLHVRSPEPLAMAGLKLSWPELRAVVEAETLGEIAWAEQLAIAELHGAAADGAAARGRAEELRAAALRLLASSATLGELWLGLGRWMMGPLLDGVAVVTFAGGYWSLTPETAGDERFAVLDRCLAEPSAVAAFYASRSITEFSPDRLPFFAVHQPNGAVIREELLLHDGGVKLGSRALEWGRRPTGAAELAATFAQHGLAVSVVPKALPLMVQIRKMGAIYVTAPPYLSQAVRFAELLGEPQHDIIKVQFDLSKALSRPAWRSLLRGYRGRATHLGNASAEETHWRTHPTLTMLYVLGGVELIERCLATATFNGRP